MPVKPIRHYTVSNPCFKYLTIPLPRPNHPKGTLTGWLGRGSGMAKHSNKMRARVIHCTDEQNGSCQASIRLRQIQNTLGDKA